MTPLPQRGDHLVKPGPFVRSLGEGVAAARGDVVVLPLAPGVGLLPLRADEVFLLQLVEDGIDGALLPGEEALAFAIDASDESVAVGGLTGEDG